MCGIVGMVSDQEFCMSDLVSRLKKLEYRGYDSHGWFDGVSIERNVGKIASLPSANTRLGIGHTRWATHGAVTEENAHPHRVGEVTIVHNGVVENWESLREDITSKGFALNSSTDSELLACLLNDFLKQLRPIEALHKLLSIAQGHMAALVAIDGDPSLYVLKRGSPMVVGALKDAFIAASDVYAFSKDVDEVYYLEDGDIAVLSSSQIEFFSSDLNASSPKKVSRNKELVAWFAEDDAKGTFSHYMLKELHECPHALERLFVSILSSGPNHDALLSVREQISRAKNVYLVACGSAFFVAQQGAFVLSQVHDSVQAVEASEFYHRVDKDSLVIAISQSGETMDVLETIKSVQSRGAMTAALVNAPLSSLTRIVDTCVLLHAGQEIAVASTKAVLNQLLAVFFLGAKDLYGNHLAEHVRSAIDDLNGLLSRTDEFVSIAHKLLSAKHLFVIGRGPFVSAAKEIALKIKELSYVHAEAFSAGELKHGAIALIEKGTPVLVIDDGSLRVRTAAAELETRGARVFWVPVASESSVSASVLASRPDSLSLHLSGVLYSVFYGQLLSFYLALLLGNDIDKPRNLAKSVTVI